MAGIANVLFHLFTLCIVPHRKILFPYFQNVLLGHLGAAERIIMDSVDAGDMGTGVNAAAFQNLSADGSGETQRCSQSAGEMSAAANVIEPAVPHGTSIVRMTGTRQSCQIAVVLGTGIRVLDKRTQRHAGGAVIQQTGHDLRQIFFPAGCGGAVLFRGTACHKLPQLFQINVFPRRQIVDHDTDRRSVGLPENRKGNITTPER